MLTVKMSRCHKWFGSPIICIMLFRDIFTVKMDKVLLCSFFFQDRDPTCSLQRKYNGPSRTRPFFRSIVGTLLQSYHQQWLHGLDQRGGWNRQNGSGGTVCEPVRPCSEPALGSLRSVIYPAPTWTALRYSDPGCGETVHPHGW